VISRKPRTSTGRLSATGIFCPLVQLQLPYPTSTLGYRRVILLIHNSKPGAQSSATSTANSGQCFSPADATAWETRPSVSDSAPNPIPLARTLYAPTSQPISYSVVTNNQQIMPILQLQGPHFQYLSNSHASPQFRCNIVFLFFNNLQPLFCTTLHVFHTSFALFSIHCGLFFAKQGG
jgi:hypothetical protein